MARHSALSIHAPVMMPNNRSPLLSVVIPMHNALAFIADAIASVHAQAVDVELIVVDDGSTDGSGALVHAIAPNALILGGPRRGAAAARNTGARAARGEYLAFLDADDVWLAEKTSLQLAAIAGLPAGTAAFGFIRTFSDAHSRMSEPEPGYSATTLLVRRDEFVRLGGFDESISSGEFIEWFARSTDGGMQVHMVPQTVTLRRAHAGNMTRVGGTARGTLPHALKSVLDRRRARADADGPA